MPRIKGAMGLATFILALSLALGAFPLQAATACKGLGSSACQKNSNCSWVKEYVRKDRAKVKGHCKSKPASSGGSASSKKSDSTKKSSNKDKSNNAKKPSDKSKSGSKSKSDSKK